MTSIRLLSRSTVHLNSALLGVCNFGTRKIAHSGSARFTSYFTPAHEYIKVEGNIGTCGITDFAQSALGDIVYIDLPEVGDVYEKGDSFSSVESVKAASDVYCPVGGKIVEINSKLSDEPGLVNSEAETGAWFVKMEIANPKELEGLLDTAAYKEHCDKQPH